jgi:hypothetical protein
MPGGGEASEGAGGTGGFGFATGEITAIDGTTMTVTAEDGTETTVTTSDETTLTHITEGAPGDLAVGDSVTVMGSSGETGDLTATSITEGDTGAAGGFGPVRGGAGGGVGGGGFPGGDLQDGGEFPGGEAPTGFPGGRGGAGAGGGFPGGGGAEGGMPEGFPGNQAPAS